MLIRAEAVEYLQLRQSCHVGQNTRLTAALSQLAVLVGVFDQCKKGLTQPKQVITA